MSAQPTAANQNAWIAAFRDELRKPEYKDIEIVDEVYGYDNEQKAFDADRGADDQVSRSRRHLRADLPGPARGRARARSRSTRARARSSSPACACRASPRNTCSTARSRSSTSGIRSSSATSPTMPPSCSSEGKIEGKPGDSFTIEAGNKWPGTYTIGDNGEIVTGDPLQYTADELQGARLLSAPAGSGGGGLPTAPRTSAREMARTSGAHEIAQAGWCGVTPLVELHGDHQTVRAGRGAEPMSISLCMPDGCIRSPARTAPARARSSRSWAASISPTAAAS